MTKDLRNKSDFFLKLSISFDASRGIGKKISRKGHVLNFPPKVVNIVLKENS